jgi:thiol-disulfide isomerase/thioredoxin
MITIKIITLLLSTALLTSNSFAQTISGNLKLLVNQEIKLEGFNGLKTYPISSTKIDEKGNFKLNYFKADYGVGYLLSADEKPLFVILSGENLEIVGDALSYTETIKVTKGQENQWFEQYAKEHPRREQALSAWLYLDRLYAEDALFSKQKKSESAIKKEQARIKSEDAAFLTAMPADSYVRWYLPVRKLVSSVSTLAQYRPEEVPGAIEAFRNLDYTDPRLYQSGLFKDAIEAHFWLIENSGGSLQEVYAAMNASIDAMMLRLVSNDKVLNEVTNHLFFVLERQSLFEASEYLALKVLGDERCTLDSDFKKQLETYRRMKVGNTAPDIVFDPTLFASQGRVIRALSDLESAYTLVVFGASWCPKCMEELPQIVSQYAKWQSKGVEVVFVALEDDRAAFEGFVQSFPFASYCDAKKWDGSIVQDYFVFATPTMFLLDRKREIVLRPQSVKQMVSWVDWFLK